MKIDAVAELAGRLRSAAFSSHPIHGDEDLMERAADALELMLAEIRRHDDLKEGDCYSLASRL